MSKTNERIWVWRGIGLMVLVISILLGLSNFLVYTLFVLAFLNMFLYNPWTVKHIEKALEDENNTRDS
jgi:hypothetical protein